MVQDALKQCRIK